MDNLQALYFKNRDEWRRWLEENGGIADGVWLIHYKKHAGKMGITLEEAVEEALCFGWIDGKLKRVDDEKFILRYTPRKPKSVWSKINRDRAERMISLGKMTRAGFDKIEEAKGTGAWQGAYTNAKKEDMPDDLREALLAERGAWKNFNGFANTYWNMYIGWINSAKTAETRKRRIEKVIEQALNRRNQLSL